MGPVSLLVFKTDTTVQYEKTRNATVVVRNTLMIANISLSRIDAPRLLLPHAERAPN